MKVTGHVWKYWSVDFEKGPKRHSKMNNVNVSVSNACNVERKKSHRRFHPRS